VKATIHWVSRRIPSRRGACLQSAVRPARSERRGEISPPISIRIRWKCSQARGLSRRCSKQKAEQPVQFERQGYFCLDRESTPERPVFIRTIGLRDTFAKDVAKDQAKDQAKAKAAG